MTAPVRDFIKVLFLLAALHATQAPAGERLVFRDDPTDARMLKLESIEAVSNTNRIVGVIRHSYSDAEFTFNDGEMYLAQAKARLAAGRPYRALRLDGWDVGKCVRSRGKAIRYRARTQKQSLWRTIFEESKGPGAALDMAGYHRVFGFEGCEVENFHDDSAFLVMLDRKAYDVSDFGNFMWGACMSELQVKRWMVKSGSEINAFFWSKEQNGWANSRWFWKNWEWSGDSPADQRAILNGYRYWAELEKRKL